MLHIIRRWNFFVGGDQGGAAGVLNLPVPFRVMYTFARCLRETEKFIMAVFFVARAPSGLRVSEIWGFESRRDSFRFLA